MVPCPLRVRVRRITWPPFELLEVDVFPSTASNHCNPVQFSQSVL
jgi:hypothetical protein